MAFSKSFPKTGEKYPVWEEVYLTEGEEKEQEARAKEENIRLMKECIDSAKSIISEKDLKEYQTDVVNVAIALFEKISSHSVYWKENKAKEKFDEKFSQK